jgi:sugar lactone lactonase YvrE
VAAITKCSSSQLSFGSASRPAPRQLPWSVGASTICILVFIASTAFPALANAESPGVKVEAATEVTSASAILNASVNPHGFETTYRFEYGKTTSYGTNVPIPDKSVGSGSAGIKASQAMGGLEASTVYHFRVVAKNSEGTSTSKDEIFTTKASPIFSFAFGEPGSGNGQFTNVAGITVDSETNIWVADSGNNRIQKFNSKGEYLSQFNIKCSPTGISNDTSGNLWIVCYERILKYNSKGESLSEVGSWGSGNGQVFMPYDVASDTAGNIWVADSGNNRIQKFNSKGEYLSQFGTEGDGQGQFFLPVGVDVDSVGNIWVADAFNNRIQKFNSKGEYLSQFGSEGSGNGQFSLPVGIDVDLSGNVWVGDTSNFRIQKFNSKGEYLSQFGTEGDGEGQFLGLLFLAVDSSGDIWVGDENNSEVQKWIP